MKRIENKQDFYKLSRGLLLGNRLQQWNSAEFLALYDCYNHGNLPEIIGVRHAGLAFVNNKSFRCSREEAYDYQLANWNDREFIMFDEAAYDPWITFQGEVLPDENHLYLRGGTKQCYQREMWASGEFEHFKGLRASFILQKYMDSDSWECLNEILNEYEFPVVELTCFSRQVGVLGWNTIFWETRTSY